MHHDDNKTLISILFFRGAGVAPTIYNLSIPMPELVRKTSKTKPNQTKAKPKPKTKPKTKTKPSQTLLSLRV